MKKLKAVLILLLALVMSLALFACGGGEEENPGGDQPSGDQPGGDQPGGDQPGGDQPGGEQGGGEEDDDDINYLSITLIPATITLTDSDDAAALDAKLAAVQVRADDLDMEEVEMTLENCNYDSKVVKIHEVGEYSFEVRPKDGRADKEAFLTVVIEHDWQEEGDNVKVCRYNQCKARQTTTEEDVVIHYGTFHEGTSATLPTGQWAETSVYTNKKTTSNISEFGSVNGRNVPTLTAGKLEPGMTITIRGKVMTTAQGGEGTESGPWMHKNENWNSPSLGIADRYNNSTNADHLGYAYGTSVIVRQEGWVLYNGIGEGNKNTLGGIMGGFFETAGGWRNFGSHINATETTTPGTGQTGYVPGEIPSDWSKVNDWWVYSTGTMHRSADDLDYHEDASGKPDISQAAEYEYTWNYREDGVIEIIYTVTEDGDTSTLKAYIKVPESSVGYYDTIIHGDFNDMTITESVVTTKRTPTYFRYKGLKANSTTVYAENKPFDAATLDVEVQYEQTGETWNPLQVSAGQVYRYLGTVTRDQLGQEANKAEFESTDPEKWVSLGTNNSLVANAIYKIHIDKGGQSWDYLIPANAFTVLANKVDSAEGANATVGDVLFANNDKVGDFEFSVDATNKNIVLTLKSTGYVQTLTNEQKGNFTGTTNATKYIALRLNAGELGAAFSTSNISVKRDTTAVAYAAVLEGDDLYLVLAVDAAGKYTVTGAQTTPIVLDLSKLSGFSIDSTVDKGEGLPLNKGGEVTLTYKVPTGTTVDKLTLSIDGTPNPVSGMWLPGTSDLTQSDLGKTVNGQKQVVILGSCTIVYATYANNTLTLKLEVPAADLANYAPVRVELALSGTPRDAVVDTIDYDLSVAEGDGYVAGSGDNAGNYVYASANGKLSVVRAFEVSELKDGTVSGKVVLNINNGNEQNFKANRLLTVEYRVVDGKLVLLNAPTAVTGYVKLLGTYGDDRDVDLGAYVVLTVDLATLGITGDYYFEYVEAAVVFDSDTHPTSIYKVSGTTLTSLSLASGYTFAPFSAGDGDCYEAGLYAWAVTKDNSVVCYAGAATAGGNHVDANDDNTCDLCGGAMSETVSNGAWTWYGTGIHVTETLKAGDVIDAKASFKDEDSTYGTGGFAILLTEMNARNQALGIFVFSGLGDVAYNTPDAPGGDVWKNRGGPHAEVEGFEDYPDRVNNPLITEEHPYNTFNGALDKDGNEITTANMATIMDGGMIRYTVFHNGDTIVVRMQFFVAGQTYSDTPQFELTSTVKGTAGLNYELLIMGNDKSDAVTDGNRIDLVRGNTVNTMISGVESATVSGHTAPTTIEYAKSKDTKNAIVKLTGMAAGTEGAYYASFKITFERALADSSVIKLVDAEGKAISGAVCTLAENKESVEVYLPIANGLQEAYIDLTNYEANTAQADIRIDVSDLKVSNITSALTGADDLTIAEGSVTVTYTGSVKDTDTLVIGEVSKAISELKGATAVDYGNGYSAKATVAATTTTVTITKAAADLTKKVEGVEIRLERDGGLLATNTLAPALTVAGGTKLNDLDWYVKADGTQLILFSNAGGSLNLNVNAGEATEKELVNVYDLSVGSNGALQDTTNALAKVSKTVYSASGETKLYVVVIDLTSFGVEGKAYGYQAVVDGAAKDYYTVNAQRTISAATAPVTTGDPTQLVKGSCIVSGVAAYATTDKTFYYNVTVTAAEGHEWVEAGADVDKKGYDKVYTCSNECGALKYEQNSDIVAISSSWGKKNDKGDKYLGWNDGLSWETFGVLYKGGSYEITGLNLSNQGNVWEFPEPGLTDDKDNGADGFRLDNYVQNDNSNLPWDNTKDGVVYTFVDAKNPDFSYSFDNVTAAVKSHLNGATITYTFDYTAEDRIVLTMHLVNGEDLDFTATVTLTGNLADSYYLAFHADANLYTASKVETVVPSADKAPATALSKHQHDFNNDNDRCAADGVLNPNHGDTEKGGKAHAYDATHHCTICGILDPAHTHTYNKDNGATCECGAVNPAHTHAYVNGECKYCGRVEGWSDSYTDDGWTHDEKTGTLTGANWNWYRYGVDGNNPNYTVKQGEILYTVGSLQSSLAENWDSVLFEFNPGLTVRIDAYGWTYTAGLVEATYLTEIEVLDSGNNNSWTGDWDGVWKKLGTDVLWRIEFNWTDAQKITVKFSATAQSGDFKDSTFVCTFTCAVVEDAPTETHVDIAAEDCTITVNGYKKVSAQA